MADAATKNNAEYVTQGKPKTIGAIYCAPVGTPLPTDAVSALDAAFKNVGYISSDGLTNSQSRDSSGVNAWGGDRVLNLMSSKTDEFKFAMMETMNTVPLGVFYGQDNVTGTLETGITVKSNTQQLPSLSWVIDMVLKNNALKRIVIPSASVTDTGDITYKDDDATVFDTTIGATPDGDGNTHYEYIVKSAGTTTGGDQETTE